jgi:hypothetical protein
MIRISVLKNMQAIATHPEVSTGRNVGSNLISESRVKPVQILPPQVNLAKWNLVKSINFSMLLTKLCHSEGEGWSNEKAREAIHKYKQWLYLKLHNPNTDIVPSKLIDEVWHYHILDTRAYAQDCQHVFGKFLHHFPYFGIRGEDDAEKLRIAFAESQQLFLNVWQEEMCADSSICTGGDGSVACQVNTCK